MKILITGVTGFVGTHLARSLKNLGHDVTGLDLLMPDSRLGIKFVRGDLVSRAGFEEISWGKLDAVYHLASMGVKPDARQWASCVEVNIKGTLNLLETVASAGCDPVFIYTHSFYEDALGLNPALRENPYILTKSIATSVVRTFAGRYQGRVVDICVFQIYGPGDSSTTVLPYVCGQLIKGKDAILGSGAGLRDWIYIDDVVSGLVSAMTAGEPGQINTYDLGSGQFVSVREIVERLASLLGMKDHLIFNPENDRPDTDLKMCASRLLPNWGCQTSPEEGLAALVRHYRAGK